jgi:hypothetical protein
MLIRAIGLFALGSAFSIRALADEKVTFNEHIRPILSNNCFACHGSDEKHREAKRRLDTAAGATAEREGIRAIVPGDLKKSELWLRITSPDADEVMPSPKSHKPPLKPEQRELIKRWIEQGAVYQNHWAYEPLSRPRPPAASAGAGEHPVDLNATLLHCLGIDHAKFTFKSQRLDQRLTGVEPAQVVKWILA